MLLGIVDRLDTLAGLFALGLVPTGTKDPFALRRTALSLIQNLIDHDMDFEIEKNIYTATANLPETFRSVDQKVCIEFIIGRLSNYLIEQGYRYDVVNAVVEEQGKNPAGAARAVKQLQAWVERKDWDVILPAYARCVRIIRAAPTEDLGLSSVDESYLVEPAEKELYSAFQKTVNRPPSTVDDFLNIVDKLIPAINTFFDTVLVMAEDESFRRNRLALVGQIANLSRGIADLSKLEGF
jgi:glycyl-tRNA synthetase